MLRFIAFDTRLHYIISEYWRTGRRRGGNNQNFVPPPVEADTNEDDWGVFSKVERVYICIFNQSLSLSLSLFLSFSLSFFLFLSLTHLFHRLLKAEERNGIERALRRCQSDFFFWR